MEWIRCHHVKCLYCTCMFTVWKCIFLLKLKSLSSRSQTFSHPTDSQQPVAEPSSRWPRGLLLHAAPRLPSLRHLLLALPSVGRRRRRPRLRGLPQSAEPVRPRLPEQLLQCRLPPHAGRQRSPRLWEQARVRKAHVQHRCAAHEGQRARGQHLVGYVIRVPCACLENKFIGFFTMCGNCPESLKSYSKQAVCHSQYRSSNIFHTAVLFRSASYVTPSQIWSQSQENRVWINYVDGKCVRVCGSLHILRVNKLEVVRKKKSSHNVWQTASCDLQ